MHKNVLKGARAQSAAYQTTHKTRTDFAIGNFEQPLGSYQSRRAVAVRRSTHDRRAEFLPFAAKNRDISAHHSA
jgi:hypothetical protein